MQILHPSLSLYFVSTGTTKTTTSLVKDSINITKQLYNDLHSSSNSCSLQLRADNSTIIEDIIKDDSDIKATLTDGNTTLFTGILSNEHTWRVSTTGEDVFQIKLEDIGTRYLNKPLVDEDGVCIKDTLQNVITSIATRCSISTVTFDNTVTSTIKNKELINKVSSSTTCKDALDAICYEYGLVYYFNESGNLVIRKTAALNGSPSTTIATTGNYAHYLYENDKVGVDLTRKSRQYSQAKVQFSTISDSESIVPIYAVTEKITVPAGEWWDGATHNENIYEYTLDEFFVADKTYYIYQNSSYVEATVTVGQPIPDNTYYEYAGTASLIDMVDSAAGKDILYVYPNTIVPNLADQSNQYPGYVERVAEPLDVSKWTLKQHNNTTKMEVLIDNSLGSISSIYSLFQAKGRIIRKQGTSNIYRSVVGLTANSEVQFNYESQWIHNKDDAIALCEMLSNYYLYCDNTYTFYCIDDLDLGTIVNVKENLFSGLDVNMLLTAKQYTGYGNTVGLYKYTAQGITAFNLNANTRAESYEVPTGLVTLVSTNTTYALDDQGTDPSQVTGWQSTIPTGTAGDFLWTRTEYVYSSGQIVYEYSVSYIAGQAFEFKLNVTPSNLIQDRRRTDSQTFTFSTVIQGYTGTPTISYWFDDEGDADDPVQSATAAALTVQIPFDQRHSMMYVRATLTSAPAQNAEILALDDTDNYVYYGQFNIDTSDYFDADGNLVPTNYDQIDWTDLDDVLATNTQFLEGDSFFNNYSESGFEDLFIYTYQNEKWVPLRYSTFSNSIRSIIAAQSQKDILSTIPPGSVTKSDFGYFNDIIVGTVTADYIGSEEIEIQNGGFLYAGNVDLTQPAGQRVDRANAGFCFDSLGNAEMSNIRITGESTVEGGSTVLGTLINYDANGDPVFKTVKESVSTETIEGAKLDGTANPSAYLWSDLVFYLSSVLSSGTDTATYQTSSPSTLYGYWNGSSISNKTVSGFKYFSSAPSSTKTTSRVNCSSGIGTTETKEIYRNNYIYGVTLNKINVHAKTRGSIWGQTGSGSLDVKIYNSDGTLYSNLYSKGHTQGTGGDGNNYHDMSNVYVPKGCYITCTFGYCDDYPWGHDDTNGSGECTYVESENFSQGINLVTSNGDRYLFNNVFPAYNDYQTYAQSLTCSNLSIALNMQMSSSSSWPIQKYYIFRYDQQPTTTATVTTSIFGQDPGDVYFKYGNTTFNVASITYNRNFLKVTATTGRVFEFSTANGNYYPQYSFHFKAMGQSLGAYARSFLPTDDSNTHNIGASTAYDSGNSQRWDTGFFTSLDVSQGVVAKTMNAGLIVNRITTNTTLTDEFEVGAMRIYLMDGGGSASAPTVTMPGTSSQSYLCVGIHPTSTGTASKVACTTVAGGGTLSESTWVATTNPYCVLLIYRLA